MDVWDTIIRRRCHPDEVKLFTARCIWLQCHRRLCPEFDSPWRILEQRVQCERALGRRCTQAGGDDEYRIEEVFAELAKRILAHEQRRADIDALVAEWVDREFRHEQWVAYPDAQIESLLDGLDGQPFVLISDFYMDGRRLTELVRSVAPFLKPACVYASCDHGLNKRSGRLFRKVHDDHRVAAAQHVHIGDNEQSDRESPERLGVRALRYDNPSELRRKAEHDRRFASRRETLTAYTQELEAAIHRRCQCPPELSPRQRDLFHLGSRCAPLYYGYVLFAVEEATKRGAQMMYYFTREGETFRRIHEAARLDGVLDLPTPRAETLEVSRISTFLPSLRTVSTDEFMRVWNLYSTQSLGALLRTLDLDPQGFASHASERGLDISEPVQYPWQRQEVNDFFADAGVRSRILETRDRRRDLLMRYLAQRGIRPQQRDLFIVDIGWRGTIQDNLAYLLPNTHITGCYLGLLNLLNEQPPNVEKLCYGPDESRDPPHVAESIRFVSPLEMLANTGAGSVHGYADQDGRVVAIRDAAAHENHVHTCYTQHFQQGVLAAVGMISDWVRTYAISAAEMRPLCLRLLARFARDPPRILARAFFDLSHNETFGVGRYVQRRRWFPYGLAALGLFSRRWRGELVRRLEQTGWPQGFLKLHRLDRLCARYNRAVDKRFGQR